ncbi:olfactory receptor 6Y1-like [Latimeria chalumnae]|uniref:olfactory receptor 6Y1-like n=1 Tax=Latimeria chalumnae TaxID=7897 RepID=UPI00313D7400
MVYLNNCNETDHFVQEFILLGFAGLQHSQTSLFFVFLFAYLIILVGNVMILLIVTSERKLHTPMYIFLRSLSILDIIYPTVILPKMLALFLVGDNIISFFGCFAQMYFFLSFGTVESILLSVMSFDRYLAICSPLRYPTIMTNQVCTMLIISVYFLGFLTPVVAVVFLMQLPYRGPRIINHCYCDYPSVLNLACSDTAFILDMAFTSAIIKPMDERRSSASSEEDSSCRLKCQIIGSERGRGDLKLPSLEEDELLVSSIDFYSPEPQSNMRCKHNVGTGTVEASKMAVVNQF